MPLGQSWLNAWVKVNSKHVVLTPNQKKVDKEQSSGDHRDDSTATEPTTANTNTHNNQDPENQAIRRFNSRKHKRRLQKTVSASDLLRDKAKEKGAVVVPSDNKQQQENNNSKIPETDKVQNDTTARRRVAQHEEIESSRVVSETDDGEDSSSLRFVAGFFGADIERYSSGYPDAAVTARAGNYFDSSEAASVHLVERRSKSPLDAASIVSRGVQSVPPAPSHLESRYQGVGGIGIIRFPPNPFAGDNHNSKGSCKHCKELEHNSLSAQEDLEYLRSLALQREYTCQCCKRGDESSSLYPSPEAAVSSIDGAQMLNDVTARHKSQIEQITKERARWQQDTHFKLQKFANLCKDLNEEAALRNEEALTLHQELGVIRSERDDMATEIEKLKGQLAIQEKREQEHQKVEETLKQYEQKGLDGADKAIQTRDAIILDLTCRLERALDTLDVEREQQRQRRQIIFPTASSRAASNSRVASNYYIGDELESELKETKDALRESLSTMNAMGYEFQTKEMAWKVKIESLERQVDAARSQ